MNEQSLQQLLSRKDRGMFTVISVSVGRFDYTIELEVSPSNYDRVIRRAVKVIEWYKERGLELGLEVKEWGEWLFQE